MKTKILGGMALAGWVALAYEILRAVMQFLAAKPGG